MRAIDLLEKVRAQLHVADKAHGSFLDAEHKTLRIITRENEVFTLTVEREED
jgi:hypothetical protein